MSRIKIKNFGPIKEGFLENDGWMDVKKVTVFIGNQGSGKSTVAKLISTMMWLEKAYHRGDLMGEEMTGVKFVEENCAYHRIHNYITENTEIHYEGILFTIIYKNRKLSVDPTSNKRDYGVPKIMYVPSERNFLSVVEGADDVVGLPHPLHTFSKEFDRSKRELNGSLGLPISKLEFEYNKTTKTSEIIGEKDSYRIDLLEASSGLQSSVPLFLVSRNIAFSISNNKKDNSKVNLSSRQSIRRDIEIMDVRANHKLTETEKLREIKLIEAKYIYKCFVNIVEEVEQNLFPTSQRQMLNSLLEFNNMSMGNKLVLTTHSPYLIQYLTLAIKANKLKGQIQNDELSDKLKKIVPLDSTVKPNDWVVYELDESNGSIKKLGNYKDLPDDNNYLNERMGETNELFAQLLGIEELCR